MKSIASWLFLFVSAGFSGASTIRGASRKLLLPRTFECYLEETPGEGEDQSLKTYSFDFNYAIGVIGEVDDSELETFGDYVADSIENTVQYCYRQTSSRNNSERKLGVVSVVVDLGEESSLVCPGYLNNLSKQTGSECVMRFGRIDITAHSVDEAATIQTVFIEGINFAGRLDRIFGVVPDITFLVNVDELAPSATPTSSPTVSPAPSTSPTISLSPSSSPSLSSAPTDVPTISAAPTTSPTISSVPTASPTVSHSPTASPTVSAVPTASPTVSSSPTMSPTVSSSPTGSPTISSAPTSSPTVSSSPTIAPTISVLPTGSPTSSNGGAGSGPGNGSNTSSPTVSISPTASPTVSAAPTESPTVSSSPTSSPSVSSSPTMSPTVSSAPTESPTVSTSPTSSPTVSNSPTISPTVSALPTGSPTSSNGGAGSGSGSDTSPPTVSASPTVSVAPSSAPTVSSMPSSFPSISDMPSSTPTEEDPFIIAPRIFITQDEEDDDDGGFFFLIMAVPLVAAAAAGALIYSRRPVAAASRGLEEDSYPLVGTGDHPTSFHEGMYHYTRKGQRYLSTRCEECYETWKNGFLSDSHNLGTIPEDGIYEDHFLAMNATSLKRQKLSGYNSWSTVDVHKCVSATCEICQIVEEKEPSFLSTKISALSSNSGSSDSDDGPFDMSKIKHGSADQAEV